MTTAFGNYIIHEAARWLSMKCQEDASTANRGVCVDYLKSQFGRVADEEWCAQFVWVVVNNAAHNAGAQNPLKKTQSTLDMLQAAQRSGLRVNTTPQLGAIFYRDRFNSSGKRIGGHVGVMVGTEGTKWYAIEGNADDKIKIVSYRLAQFSDARARYRFMHVQDMQTQKPWTGAPLNLVPAGKWYEARNLLQYTQENPFLTTLAISAFAVGGYIFYDKFFKD